MFSVNVLLYGSYTWLAKRCLSSIVVPGTEDFIAELRIGLNAVCPETRQYVADLMQTAPYPVYVYEPEGRVNALKYPLMRKMFYDPARPIPTKHVMWFDDDSFVRCPEFWQDIAEEVNNTDSPLIGSVYRPGFFWSKDEVALFKEQPWFTGIDCSSKPKFITGGWWVADLNFLAKFDYPFRVLLHNGGDTIMGEVLRQQGKVPHHYQRGVAINADEQGRESNAKRRGVTTSRPFAVPAGPSPEFEVNVTTNRIGT